MIRETSKSLMFFLVKNYHRKFPSESKDSETLSHNLRW